MNKIILLMVFVLLSSFATATVAVEDLQAVSDNSNTLILGTLYYQNNTQVNEVLSVDVFCDNLSIATVNNEVDGTFALLTQDCHAGSFVSVEAQFDGSMYVSEQVEIRYSAAIDYGTVDLWVGVPEFSTATMSLAILGAVLGVVALRREN